MAAGSFLIAFGLTHFAAQSNLTLVEILMKFPWLANATVGGIVMAAWHYLEKKYGGA